MGGMILGTLIGVLFIPGLYYIFGKMAEGKQMIKGEHDESLTEEYVHDIIEKDKIWNESQKSNPDESSK
jgi:HAE1 family hydrophobic/amphiphilic exporter-1